MRVFQSLALAAAIPLLALALSGCDEKSKAETPPPPPPQVGIVTVTPQHLAMTTELPGRTAAVRIAEIRPQVTGIIQKRLFTEGSQVKAGQQLYQIDPRLYQAALESAEANLAKATANAKSARVKANRYKELVAANAVSKQEYDDMAATLAQNEADVGAAKAAVATARINLAYTKVVSPISGSIGKSAVTEGALATANQASALATVTQLDPIYVDVTQSTDALLKLRRSVMQGTRQHAKLDDTPVSLLLGDAGEPYGETGRLQFSDVTVDEGTGSIHLRALFPNPNRILLPGMFVRAEVAQGSVEDAILIPQQALVRNADSSTTVWVVGADLKVAARPVTVSRAIKDQWLVTSGLHSGDRIVVEGLQKIRPGATVRIGDAGKAAPQAARTSRTDPAG